VTELGCVMHLGRFFLFRFFFISNPASVTGYIPPGTDKEDLFEPECGNVGFNVTCSLRLLSFVVHVAT
jgi:hypothetical protein